MRYCEMNFDFLRRRPDQCFYEPPLNEEAGADPDLDNLGGGRCRNTGSNSMHRTVQKQILKRRTRKCIFKSLMFTEHKYAELEVNRLSLKSDFCTLVTRKRREEKGCPSPFPVKLGQSTIGLLERGGRARCPFSCQQLG